MLEISGCPKLIGLVVVLLSSNKLACSAEKNCIGLLS